MWAHLRSYLEFPAFLHYQAAFTNKNSIENIIYCPFCGVGKEYLGTLDTELEAFHAYKHAKEAYVKELAEKWKDQIDPRAYNALMKYEVEITD